MVRFMFHVEYVVSYSVIVAALLVWGLLSNTESQIAIVATLTWRRWDNVHVTIDCISYKVYVLTSSVYIKGTTLQFRYIRLFMLYRLLCYKRRSELPFTRPLQ
ncbi:Tkp4 protein [Vanderwaltozyma polyspora DSM 70294]|uniref:Tkp4 protein n=1 Tax=Vanderwaltozyma polyspora (strain ATCC 22028 / DSM 70294 / BCRC 21397 / CBS 2163 / NBRC 10782 / NRRL Y-8283 / UCD 57-17) TaxID=436907 RepID=A7TT62_VANPO|nr:Tkp4 protein [Vanderwaltozyma polyspora DSM 70294]EDO14547.1 Tkp4 protein [Vanderwaltozyma polyspora DSM 70294]